MEIELKKGDILYCFSPSGNISITKIDRTTKTTAVSSAIKFDKVQKNSDYILSKGRNTWSQTYYSLRSEKLDLLFRKQQIIRKIKSISLKDIDLDKLSSIYKILTD